MSHRYKLYKPVEKKSKWQRVKECVIKAHKWLWEPVNDPVKINKTMPASHGRYAPFRVIPRWMWYTVWVIIIVTVFKELLL